MICLMQILMKEPPEAFERTGFLPLSHRSSCSLNSHFSANTPDVWRSDDSHHIRLKISHAPRYKECKPNPQHYYSAEDHQYIDEALPEELTHLRKALTFISLLHHSSMSPQSGAPAIKAITKRKNSVIIAPAITATSGSFRNASVNNPNNPSLTLGPFIRLLLEWA